MKKSITRFHSALEKRPSVPIAPMAGFTQRTLEQVAKLTPNSENAKRITRSLVGFIAKDLRPYLVVDNQGFRTMLQVLEPRYSVPSQCYFSDTAIPALYRETKGESHFSVLPLPLPLPLRLTPSPCPSKPSGKR